MNWTRYNNSMPSTRVVAVFVLLWVGGCSCSCTTQEGPPVPAPNASTAPRWKEKPSPPAIPLLETLPASKDRPAYDLPLQIRIEAPDVPAAIQGPSPEIKKGR